MSISLEPLRNDKPSRATVWAVRLPFILHNLAHNYPKLSKTISKEDYNIFDLHSHKSLDRLPYDEIFKEITDLKSFHLFIATMRLLYRGSHIQHSGAYIQSIDGSKSAILDIWRQQHPRFDPEEMMDTSKHEMRLSFCRELEGALPPDKYSVKWLPEKMELEIKGDIREYIDSIMKREGYSHPELASLPGTRALEWRATICDADDYICTFFVFGTNMDSPWSRKGEDSVFEHENFRYALVKEPLPWDLAVYFTGKRPRHVGIVTGEDKILSKWGPGLILEHGHLTLPAMYGDPRFFRMIRD